MMLCPRVAAAVGVLLALAAAAVPPAAAQKTAAPPLASPSLDEIRAQLAAGNAAAVAAPLRSLAEGKNVEAQILLGDLHMEGRGVLHNYSLGAGWYQRAAQAGNAEAQYKLGRLHLRGEAVVLHLERARQLFTLAAEQGHAGAIEELRKMGVKPPPLKPAAPAKTAAAKPGAAAKDMPGPAKAAIAKVEKTLTAAEARLKRLMAETEGAGNTLRVGLAGAEPPTPGAAADKKLVGLVFEYAAALHGHDVKALKRLMAPEYAACANDGNRAAYDDYLADGMSFRLPKVHGVELGVIKPDAPLPFAGRVTYPVRPTHYVLMESKAKATTKDGKVELPPVVLQLVASVNGEWSLVFGCPAAAGTPAKLAPKTKPAAPAAKKADA